MAGKTIQLAPVGARIAFTSPQELRSLVASLLATLDLVHRHGLVHLNICIDNIVKHFCAWVLMDWELAGKAGEFVWWHGKTLPDPVRERQQPYTCQTDLWQLGQLILAEPIAGDAAMAFADQLVNSNFATAPRQRRACGELTEPAPLGWTAVQF